MEIGSIQKSVNIYSILGSNPLLCGALWNELGLYKKRMNPESIFL